MSKNNGNTPKAAVTRGLAGTSAADRRLNAPWAFKEIPIPEQIEVANDEIDFAPLARAPER